MSLLDQIHEILGPLAGDDFVRLKSSLEQDGCILPVIVHAATGVDYEKPGRAKTLIECQTG